MTNHPVFSHVLRRRCRACGLRGPGKDLVEPWHTCSEDCADAIWLRVTHPVRISDQWLTLLTCLAFVRSTWRPVKPAARHQASAHRRMPTGAAFVQSPRG